MIPNQTFHLSGQREKENTPPNALASEFDITNDVKYESLRNQACHGRLYRQHQDLTRECERQIRSYELGQQMFILDYKRCQQKLENRLSELVNKAEKYNKLKYSYNQQNTKSSYQQPTKKTVLKKHSTNPGTRDKRNTLLFTVMHRDGEDIYITNPKERFRTLGPLKSLGKSLDDSHIGLRRNECRPPPKLVRELTM